MDHAYRNDWRLDRLQTVLATLFSLNPGLSSAQYGDDPSAAQQAGFVAVRAARRGASGFRYEPRRNSFSRKPVSDV